MSLKIITALFSIVVCSAVHAHGQHGDVEDLPPPPKMEVEVEPAADLPQPSAESGVETKAEVRPEASKPDDVKPNLLSAQSQ